MAQGQQGQMGGGNPAAQRLMQNPNAAYTPKTYGAPPGGIPPAGMGGGLNSAPTSPLINVPAPPLSAMGGAPGGIPIPPRPASLPSGYGAGLGADRGTPPPISGGGGLPPGVAVPPRPASLPSGYGSGLGADRGLPTGGGGMGTPPPPPPAPAPYQKPCGDLAAQLLQMGKYKPTPLGTTNYGKVTPGGGPNQGPRF
jgi:hypothetical protein